jgi:hypothetical protein
LYRRVFEAEGGGGALNLPLVVKEQNAMADGADFEGEVPHWVIPQADLLAALGRLKVAPTRARAIRRSLVERYGLVSSFVWMERSRGVEVFVSRTDPLAKTWDEWKAEFGNDPPRASRLLKMLLESPELIASEEKARVPNIEEQRREDGRR